MSEFTRHTLESAPQDSRPLLESAKADYGMIPNLLAVLAESPGTLEAYQKLNQLVLDSSFNKEEITVLWQSINVEHDCHYCQPAHSAIARQMGVSEQIDQALREKQPLDDEKLEALRTFTLATVRERGAVGKEDLAAFRKAGYDQRQVLEVVLAVSQKTISNYINNMADTPVDEPFKAFA